MLAHEAVVFEVLPDGVDGLVHVTEYGKHPHQEQEVVQGNANISLTEEGFLEYGMIQVIEFEDIQRPVNACGNGDKRHQRN